MSMDKDTTPKPAGLPEKEWFTLEEIAERWKTDRETLLHWSRLELLKLSNQMQYFQRDHTSRGLRPWFNAVIKRDERDRFEIEHRMGAHAGTMPKADREGQLDPRLERTYLQIIRVMIAELKLSPEPYKAAEILAAYAARRGFEWPKKRDTVANRLKAARELED